MFIEGGKRINNNNEIQFGDTRWTRAIFLNTLAQAILAIVFEAIIFVYHARVINIINEQQHHQIENGHNQSLITAYANARSLLVYFTLFIVAQVFTVALVIDAVRHLSFWDKRTTIVIRDNNHRFIKRTRSS